MQQVAHKPQTAWRRIALLQGESHVTSDQTIVLTTVLGSCIACCLYDPRARIGGMNHFLLSQAPERSLRGRQEAERYGVFAMEMLVNEMLKRGATRSSMRAHLYGGGNLHRGMHAIGTDNANFAKDFLAADGIGLAHSDVGGTLARRVDFRAAVGQARSRVVEGAFAVPPPRKPVLAEAAGEVELF